MMYGAPNTWSAKIWKPFSERPINNVSMSVNGAVPSQDVCVRKSEPGGGSWGTSM